MSGVAVGASTFKEVTAGAILPANSTTNVSIKLSGTNVFTAGITPTIVLSAGLTSTKPVSTAVATYTFAVTTPATLSGPATVTVSGLTATVAAASSVAGTAITLTPTPAAGSAKTAINVVNYASRIGGSDRYATAANLFNSQFGTTATGLDANATNVVLASGALFPDALSADFLSGQLKTGILLTTPNVLPSVTGNVLVNGKITTVYILGGTGRCQCAGPERD